MFLANAKRTLLRRSRAVRTLLAAAAITANLVGAANATVIDFSAQEVPGTYVSLSSPFAASGFIFSSPATSYLALSSATQSNPLLSHPAPGNLLAVMGDTGTAGLVTFSAVGGGAFTSITISSRRWTWSGRTLCQ